MCQSIIDENHVNLDYIQIIQEKFSTQEGVQSSSALSYLGNMCSWVTSVGTRSSPLHLIVNQFLQNDGFLKNEIADV